MNIRTFINLAHVGILKENGSRSSKQNRDNEGTTDRDTERSCTYKGRSSKSCGSGQSKGSSGRPDKGCQVWRERCRAVSVRKAVLQLHRTPACARKEGRGKQVSYFLAGFPTFLFSTPLDYEIDRSLFPQGFIIIFLIFVFGYLLSRKFSIQQIINAMMDDKKLREIGHEDNN